MAKSTEVATKKSTAVALPANAQEIMAQRAAALSKMLSAPQSKAITFDNKTFKMTAESEGVEEFKGVIISVAAFNAYYEGAYVDGARTPPNCFAIGFENNDDLIASKNSPDPQNPDGENACSSCWANEFGSGNGKGKACKNERRLAILCADGEVRTLKLSPTALTPFDKYCREVASAHGCAPLGVMTTFYFDPVAKYESVRCKNPIKLNDAQLAEVLTMIDDADAMLLREPDVSEFEEKVVALRNKSGKNKLPTAKGRARV